jgi:competence protein ComEC
MGGMLLLLVSWIPYVNALFGYLVWGAIYVMNWIVSWIESLPLSIIKNLYISPLEFSLLLVGFVLLLLAVSMQKRQLLMGMLCTIMLFMVSVTIRLYSADNQHGVIFFSLRKHTAVDFYTGTNHILLADSTLMDDEATVDYSLRGFWSKRSLSAHPKSVSLDEDFDGPFLRKRHNLVSFNGKLLALWNDADATKDSLSYRLPIDYLLVSERQKPDLQSVVNVYKPQLLLIDGSVPNYLAERWTAQAEEHGIPCLNTADGAAEF